MPGVATGFFIFFRELEDGSGKFCISTSYTQKIQRMQWLKIPDHIPEVGKFTTKFHKIKWEHPLNTSAIAWHIGTSFFIVRWWNACLEIMGHPIIECFFRISEMCCWGTTATTRRRRRRITTTRESTKNSKKHHVFWKRHQPVQPLKNSLKLFPPFSALTRLRSFCWISGPLWTVKTSWVVLPWCAEA